MVTSIDFQTNNKPTTTMNNQPKVALLFLTIDNPHFPDIWDEWLSGQSDKYDIFIHPKNPDDVTWHRERILPSNKLVHTAWGEIVYAYGALFAAATDSGTYAQYVLISESDLPICGFDAFYRFMSANTKVSYYNRLGGPSNWDCINRLQHVPGYCRFTNDRVKTIKSQIVKHDARFSLCHDHAVKFSDLCHPNNQSAFVYELFQSPVCDEFCLSVLNLDEFVNYGITYDCWHHTTAVSEDYRRQIAAIYDRRTIGTFTVLTVDDKVSIKELRLLRNNVRKSPIAIDDLSRPLLNCPNATDLDILKRLKWNHNPPFLCRKFAKTSNVREFWQSILDGRH